MSYYRWVGVDTGENIMMKRVSHRGISTTGGSVIDPEALELPLEIEMWAGEEHGYDQYDPDFDGELVEQSLQDRLQDYYRLSSLMTPELVNTLRAAGVEQLQTFPVKITDAMSGETLDREYLFVNITCVVSCADLESSEQDAVGDAYHFHSLRIDEAKTQGAPLFRLAESPIEVIVNEKVSRTLREGNFAGLDLEAVS